MDMSQFSHDHREILQQLEQLEECLRAGVRAEAEALGERLLRLGAKIRLHLVIEDRFLYPTLVTATHRPTAALARLMADEMNQLSAEFTAFLSQYASADAIVQDPTRFARECSAMIESLRARIQREDRELYPLAADI